MKALTLTQPWATLIAIGAKRIETRSWWTGYRGPIAIHAGKNLAPVGGEVGLLAQCADATFFRALEPHVRVVHRATPIGLTDTIDPDELPRGCVVAIADLVDCKRIAPSWTQHTGAMPPKISRFTDDGEPVLWELTEQEIAFGDYTPGRFAWLLDNVRALPVPVPARGAQGLWDWNETGLISEGA